MSKIILKLYVIYTLKKWAVLDATQKKANEVMKRANKSR